MLTRSIFERMYVQILNRMQNNKNNNVDEEFNLLRLLDKKPDKSQRKIAQELGFSIGKLNYCMKALKKKACVLCLLDLPCQELFSSVADPF